MEKSIKLFHNSIRNIKKELENQISPPIASEMSQLLGLQWLILWRLQKWGYLNIFGTDFETYLIYCNVNGQNFFQSCLEYFKVIRTDPFPVNQPKWRILQKNMSYWFFLSINQYQSIHIGNQSFNPLFEFLNSFQWENWALLDFNFLLGNLFESGLEQNDRKKHGIYYTPLNICQWMVRQTLTHYIENSNEKQTNIIIYILKKIQIMDPAAGSGHFLDCCVIELLNLWHEMDPSHNDLFFLQEFILSHNISGYDLNPLAVLIIKARLILHFLDAFQKSDQIILPNVNLQIECQNSILNDYSPQDLIIGNPPFGGRLTPEEIIALSSFQISKNNLAKAFLMKSITWLTPNGILCFILPKALTYTKDWEKIRKSLLPSLIGLYDMKEAFDGVLLEQIIVLLCPAIKSRKYKANVFGSSNQSIEIDKEIISDTWYCDLTLEELVLVKNLINQSNIHYISELVHTFRGLPLQSLSFQNLSLKNSKSILGGKDITRYNVRPSKRMINYSDIPPKHLKSLTKYHEPKLIFQNIVAYISKPTAHIRVMGTFDSTGLLILDTLNVVHVKNKSEFLSDPYVILGLMNSILFSFLMHRFAFNNAVRTMHLDNYALNKVPIFVGSFLRSPDIHDLVKDLLSVGWNVQKYLLIEHEILHAYGLTLEKMPTAYHTLWKFIANGK